MPSTSEASERSRRAVLFDGLSAVRNAVEVRPLSGGLVLSGDTDLVLARSELRLLASGTRQSILGRFDNPDWRLVAEPALPADWLLGIERMDRLSGRALRGWGLLGAALVAGVVLFWLKGDAMAAAVAPLVPAAVTEPMGKAMVDQLVGNRRCDTPEAKAALSRLVARLQAPRKITITVADYGFANAFAGPGGQVVLTRGLIAGAAGPDELAGVLAHELGHVARHHPTRALVRHYGFSLLAGSLGGGYADLADIGLLLASTREAEREADSYALQQLNAARISTAGLAGFFRRQMGPARPGPDDAGARRLLQEIGSYATSHPPDAERLARFQNAARPGTPAMSGADWAAIRGSCRAPQARSGG
ncbi:MAG: M48 family metallopeptidase [Sandaracinobacteroides sp.]